jgi:hypothetical protein
MHLPEPSAAFTPAPSGTHVAIAYSFIDLGTQESSYAGEFKKRRLVRIAWELPGELRDDGKPHSVSRLYTWSMHEKSKLRGDIEAWISRPLTKQDLAPGPNRFNVKDMLGRAAMLTIAHQEKDGKVFANVASVTAVPKGLPVPQGISQHVYFSLEPGLYKGEVFDVLHAKAKETIERSPEYQKVRFGVQPAPTTRPVPVAQRYDAPLDDQIPF